MNITGRKRGRALPLVLGAVIVLGGLGYLLYGGLDRNLVYFLTPVELVERGERAYDIPIRLGGTVEPGSIEWNAEALDLRFRVTDGSQEVVVQSKGAPPHMFRDSMGVIVEGRYHPTGVFQAATVMVKHSNEYRAPHPEKPSFPGLTQDAGR
jgi:cytochrome c-type biogenesis protein CcmE